MPCHIFQCAVFSLLVPFLTCFTGVPLLQQNQGIIERLFKRPERYQVITGRRTGSGTDSGTDSGTSSGTAHPVSKHERVTEYPVDFANLQDVQVFAEKIRATTDKIDCLMLYADIKRKPEGKDTSKFGSKWCKAYIVNSLCRYLH